MADVQPTWMGPLIQSDARLTQGVKLSVSSANIAGTQVISYGNNHGFSLLGGTRFQFDFNPPSYFQNHSSTMPDGFGNASTQVKYRIASGNARHGNFAVSAALCRSFGGGYEQNGMLTDAWFPKLLVGKAFGRLAVQSALNGVLPTGKISQQGRAVEWNSTAQLHAGAHAYFDIEDNAAWLKGGPDDGKTENFVTPAAFLVVRRRSWEPTHAVVVFDAGLQIATSSFHAYNRNLISEMRILF
ncbi:MAG: hypothetical protein C5B46_04450 [Proteobacteria bacterium]|nr:MAG: hypothetical protein C5B46_04450 [Pseudomonadota bacterium]